MVSRQEGARLVAVMAEAAGADAGGAGFVPAPSLARLMARVAAAPGEPGRLFHEDAVRARAVAGFIGDRLWLRPRSLSCLRPGLAPAHVGGALHELGAAADGPPPLVVGARDLLTPALGYLEHAGLCQPVDGSDGVVVELRDAPGRPAVGIDGPMAELERLALRDVAHLGTSLHEHLVNTFGLLSEFGNPEPVCLAGLYHAAYGTQGFAGAVFEPSDRTVLAELIGAPAEALVYHYCANDRDHAERQTLVGEPRAFRDRFTGTRKTLTHGMACALWEMTLANELEIAMREPSFVERYRASFTRLFTAARPYLSQVGYDRFRYVFR